MSSRARSVVAAAGCLLALVAGLALFVGGVHAGVWLLIAGFLVGIRALSRLFQEFEIGRSWNAPQSVQLSGMTIMGLGIIAVGILGITGYFPNDGPGLVLWVPGLIVGLGVFCWTVWVFQSPIYSPLRGGVTEERMSETEER